MEEKEQAITRIAQQAYIQHLQELSIIRENDHWADILNFKDWSMIKMLFLCRSQINDDNISSLLQLDWPNLNYINLSFNNLTSQGIELFGNKNWPKLENIYLGNNNIENQGLHIILQKFHHKLYNISLINCGIMGTGIQLLLDFPSQKLKCLSIGGNLIGNLGIKLLTKSYLPHLQLLSLDDCGIEGKDLSTLRKPIGKILRSFIWDTIKGEVFCLFIRGCNIIQLNGWENIRDNEWKCLNFLQLFQTSSICAMKCVLVSPLQFSFEGYGIKIQNQQLASIIWKIYQNRAGTLSDKQ